jgi:hypothetical protein
VFMAAAGREEEHYQDVGGGHVGLAPQPPYELYTSKSWFLWLGGHPSRHLDDDY